ncbi:MAG: hypothetical protein CSB13_09665 [Chloroflexi bacterium]|nr:MAG: hypothetical protein CSB13_09665 [Chloroflexota bacterium]
MAALSASLVSEGFERQPSCATPGVQAIEVPLAAQLSVPTMVHQPPQRREPQLVWRRTDDAVGRAADWRQPKQQRVLDENSSQTQAGQINLRQRTHDRLTPGSACAILLVKLRKSYRGK